MDFPIARGAHPAPELPDARARWHCSRGRAAGILAESMLSIGRKRRPGPAALPLALLLLALATLFLFGGDREYFYRSVNHDWNSSQTLVFAENLSFRHNLLIFHYQYRDADGNSHYQDLYNRFPIGGYALVKLAILPFGDTAFKAKIYAGRMLMLLLFSAAAALAYLSLARISGSRWDALTATLLAFSSYYVLYYADKISNEVTIDLFAVMLVFHGMVVFVQESRFRQLVIKSCLALLLGWHVYAFLLPFIVFCLMADVFKARRFYPALRILGHLKRYILTLLRSRYLLLGIVTLLFGIAVLTFNFSKEYFALNGETPFRELPSVDSAIGRLGGDSDSYVLQALLLQPAVFWPNQFYRIGVAMLPYALNPYEIKSYSSKPGPGNYPVIAWGVLAVGFCLAGLAFSGVRRWPGALLLLATLVVSGFCWALPLRNVVVGHDFESVFYIGIPLAAVILALRFLRRWHRGRLAPYFAVAALVVFIFSVSEMADVGQSPANLAVEAEQMIEYGAIRDLVDAGASVYVPLPYLAIGDSGGAAWALSYYLSGKNIIFNDGYGPRKPYQAGDYLLLHTRVDNPALLTPEHRHVFLYDGALYNKWLRYGSLGDPIIAAEGWQVYLTNGHLTYTSQECANVDTKFFLHITPRAVADLEKTRQEYGYNNRDFNFRGNGGIRIDGDCVLVTVLPDYDIIAFRTGQYNAAGRIWDGEYHLPALEQTAPYGSE